MLEEPRIVETEARRTAVIRLTIPREEIRNVMGPGIGELLAAVKERGMSPSGPLFSHHFRMDPAVFDFEIGVPVDGEFAELGRVKTSGLPAATIARTAYLGAYEGLASAWEEFNAWIAAEGHSPAPNLWESYVSGPESDPDPASWRTELCRPLLSRG